MPVCGRKKKKKADACIHLANNEEILPFDHAVLDHSPHTFSHLFLVAVDKRSINVPVTGGDGCLHRLCDLARGRLTHRHC